MKKEAAPTISVVVPVYKVEKYLKQCIESVLNQSYGDFVLILVDDGSPDRCPEICDEYAAKDNRIKVIHQENAGVGAARNAGIDNAETQYITFLDADDYFELDLLQAYVDSMTNTTDWIVSGIREVDEEGNELRVYTAEQVKVATSTDQVDGALSTIPSYTFGFLNNKLYRTAIIKDNGLKHITHNNVNDDYLFNLKYYRLVKNLIVLPGIAHNYRININSITRSSYVNPKKFLIASNLCNEVIGMGVGNYVKQITSSFMIRWYVRSFASCLIFPAKAISWKERFATLFECIGSFFASQAFRYYGIKSFAIAWKHAKDYRKKRIHGYQ